MDHISRYIFNTNSSTKPDDHQLNQSSRPITDDRLEQASLFPFINPNHHTHTAVDSQYIQNTGVALNNTHSHVSGVQYVQFDGQYFVPSPHYTSGFTTPHPHQIHPPIPTNTRQSLPPTPFAHSIALRQLDPPKPKSPPPVKTPEGIRATLTAWLFPNGSLCVRRVLLLLSAPALVLTVITGRGLSAVARVLGVWVPLARTLAALHNADTHTQTRMLRYWTVQLATGEFERLVPLCHLPLYTHTRIALSLAMQFTTLADTAAGRLEALFARHAPTVQRVQQSAVEDVWELMYTMTHTLAHKGLTGTASIMKQLSALAETLAGSG